MVGQWIQRDEDIGYYCGFIASSFSLAQFVSSIPWGKLSDKFGRKPCLLAGLLGNSIAIITFGLSQSLWQAVLSRSLNGILNGNTGAAKCMLAEITDETNRAAAFSLFGFAFAVGTSIGPIIGGFLANPEESIPLIGACKIFKQNPYLLPCLVSSLISSFGFLLGLYFLPESLHRPDLITTASSTASADSIERLDECSPLLHDTDDSFENLTFCSEENVPLLIETPLEIPEVEHDELLTEINLAHQTLPISTGIGFPAVASICAYALLCFMIVALEETFSIWANSPIGIGLGFTPAEIGKSFLPMGIVIIITQFFIYPWIERRVDNVVIYRVSMLMFPILFAGYPIVEFLAANGCKEYVWPLLYVVHSFKHFIETFSFTSIMTLVSDSAHEGQLGLVNGYGQSVAALGRAAGPTIAGSIFAWSIQSSISFPFDKHLIWCFLVLLAILCAFQGYSLPDSLRGSRKSMNKSDEEC